MAKLNELKQTYPEFTPESFNYDLTGAVKWYQLTSEENRVLALGNFDVQQKTASITFPKTGKCYEFFTLDTFEINTVNQSILLTPGEYRLYSTQKFDDPQVVTEYKKVLLYLLTLEFIQILQMEKSIFRYKNQSMISYLFCIR